MNNPMQEASNLTKLDLEREVISKDLKRIRVQIISPATSVGKHSPCLDGRVYASNGEGQLINVGKVVRGKKAVKQYKKLRRLARGTK